MSAERAFTELHEPEESNDVYKVAQWKWGIDKGSPLWKRLFFDWIFLPFQNFAFSIGIPTPKEVEITSDEQGHVKRVFRWWEDEGIFDDPDAADAGCLEVHWGYTNLPLGRLMPSDSGTYGITIFPRKKDRKESHRWAKPKSTFVIKDRKREEREKATLAGYITELNRNLDRALDRR